MQSSILHTLSYSSVFQYPLTQEELLTRLIVPDQVDEKAFIRTLQKTPHIKQIEKYWLLEGHDSDVKIRKQRAVFSESKQPEILRLLSILKKIPSISSVYITGSLAMNNVSSESDDIDLLIVTKPNMMWISRLVVVLWTTLIGKYRLHASSGEWGWCFNLWLDQNHLEIPKNDRSVYLAYEVVQAKMILGTENELLTKNEWVNEYINYSSKSEKRKDYETRTKREEISSQFSLWKNATLRLCRRSLKRVIHLIDVLAFFIQKIYMQPRMTREKVGRGFAFFHPRATEQIILKRWREELEKIGVSVSEFLT